MPDSSVLAADTTKGTTTEQQDNTPLSMNGDTVQRESQQDDGQDSIVYVTGAIQSPGLYKVASSSTIGDVIKGAGGVLKELDSLPGIGPIMAKRIEEYRQSKGAFTSIEDIKHVKGIGDGLFKKIRDKITV